MTQPRDRLNRTRNNQIASALLRSNWFRVAAVLGISLAIVACKPVENASVLVKACLAQILGADLQASSVGFSNESRALMARVAAPERSFSARFADSEWHLRPRDPRRFFVVGSVIVRPKDWGDSVDAPTSAASNSPDGAAPVESERRRAFGFAGRQGEGFAGNRVTAMRKRIVDRMARMGLPGARVDFDGDGVLTIELPQNIVAEHVARHAQRAAAFQAQLQAGLDAGADANGLDKGPAAQAVDGSGDNAPVPVQPEAVAPSTDNSPADQPAARRFVPPAHKSSARRPVPVALIDASVDQALNNVAAQGDRDCSKTPTVQQIRDDAVLATECMVSFMRDSGDFAYVEKNYVFQIELESWIRLPKPKQAAPKSGTTPRPVNSPDATSPGATKPGSTNPVAVAQTDEPNDPLYRLQWNLWGNGDKSGKAPGAAGFADFWKAEHASGSRQIRVAIIDTGLDLSHPDVKGSKNFAQGFDFVSDPSMGNDGDGRDADANDPGDNCVPNDPSSEDSFHGTHVAGIIGANGSNNGLGVAGGAWNVTVIPVRAIGKCGGQMRDINDAIRWAAGMIPGIDQAGNEHWIEDENRQRKRADIINLSLGLYEACPASMQDAIDEAVKAGAIVVVAAGNFRIDTANYAPAGCRNVVTVAANDRAGHLAPYSNFGASVAIMAPGGDISADTDKDGQPDGILSTQLSRRDCVDPLDGKAVGVCYYNYKDGTSMAAPHVSAAFALLMAQFPGKNAPDYIDMLMHRGTKKVDNAMQCTGKCQYYFGATPLPGEESKPEGERICARPCGQGMLDLGQVIASKS